MDGYFCPACEHPVPPAAWAEASSMSEALLGRNVQSDWIEMRRCPGCELLLRRAAREQWQPAPPRLLAALQGRPPGRENGNLFPHRPTARATAGVGPASRERRRRGRLASRA
jgi:hypothetical protein